MNMLIGICGKSGSGKSTAAKTIIEEFPNAICLDIDKIGHEVIDIPEVKANLIKCFGSDILGGEKIDRKKLGDLIFNSRENNQLLAEITWKYMERLIDVFLDEHKNKIVILDWLLLPKTKYFGMCNLKVLLDIPYELRKARALKRDNITSDAFDLREKASEGYNPSDFDLVLKNNNLEAIKRKVKIL